VPAHGSHPPLGGKSVREKRPILLHCTRVPARGRSRYQTEQMRCRAMSGSDSLKPCRILTPGPWIASLAGNQVLYRDGVPTAWLAACEVTFSSTRSRGHVASRSDLVARGSRGAVACDRDQCQR
jgi:hypothetical protein